MQGKCRVLLRNGFDIMTTMIVQNTVFTTDFVLIERFDDCGFLLGGIEKKNVEPSSFRQCRANAEFSFEIGSTL